MIFIYLCDDDFFFKGRFIKLRLCYGYLFSKIRMFLFGVYYYFFFFNCEVFLVLSFWVIFVLRQVIQANIMSFCILDYEENILRLFFFVWVFFVVILIYYFKLCWLWWFFFKIFYFLGLIFRKVGYRESKIFKIVWRFICVLNFKI